ncbi:MAG: hypothetical protein V3W41_16715 [Planctomycetota bacterium]
MRAAVFALTILTLLSINSVPVLGQSEEDIDRWYERAERSYSRGQWRLAAKYFERVLAAEPDDEDVAPKLLLALFATGQYERYGELSAARLKEKPRDWNRICDHLEFLRVKGRDDDALELLARVEDPELSKYQVPGRIAQIHLNRGRDAEAEKLHSAIVEKAKSQVVRGAADLTALARAYRFYPHGGDYAEEALVSAQKADPKYLPAFVELAEVYGGLKERPSDMKREFKDALALRKNWPGFLLGQARAAALRLGQAEGERINLIERVLNTNPHHPDALAMRGMNELGDAQWQQAEQTFRAGLTANPDHLACLSGLASKAWLEGKTAVFDELKGRILQRDPTYGQLFRYIADALNDRRRWEEALGVMREAVKVDPANFRLWDDLARYAIYIGEEKEGRAALKKADSLVRYGNVWRNNMYTVLGLLEKSYETTLTPHYVLKLHKTDRPLLERIFPAFIERSWDELVKRYGFTPKAPIIFEVFRRSKDFSVRTMGTRGLPALGVCFGSTVAMDSPRARRPGTYNWAGTAHHEIAHVFTLQLSGGRVPRWLTEGLSSWEEVRRDPSWGRNLESLLHDAWASDELLGVLEFDKAFSTSAIVFAYFQAGLCSQWLEKNWGMEAIQKMLRLYGEDKHSRAVLREALGVSPQEFDKGFRNFVEKHLGSLKRMPRYSETALDRFRDAIANNEDVDENRIKLAWGHFRHGRDFDADAVLQKLNRAGVKDPRIDFLFGLRAVRAKRLDVAAKYFASAENSGFEDFELFALLAGFAEKAGKSVEAIEYWRRAAIANPFLADPKASPYLNLARLARGEGDLDAWAAWTERFCALVDVAVEARWELFEFRKQKKEWQKSRTLLDEIARVSPFDPRIYEQRAELAKGLDDWKQAGVEFETALDLGLSGTAEIKVRFELAKVLMHLGETDQAAYHLGRVLEVDPKNGEAKSLLRKAEKQAEQETR